MNIIEDFARGEALRRMRTYSCLEDIDRIDNPATMRFVGSILADFHQVASHAVDEIRAAYGCDTDIERKLNSFIFPLNMKSTLDEECENGKAQGCPSPQYDPAVWQASEELEKAAAYFSQRNQEHADKMSENFLTGALLPTLQRLFTAARTNSAVDDARETIQASVERAWAEQQEQFKGDFDRAYGVSRPANRSTVERQRGLRDYVESDVLRPSKRASADFGGTERTYRPMNPTFQYREKDWRYHDTGE